MSKNHKAEVIGLENINEAVKGLKLTIQKLPKPLDLSKIGTTIEEKIRDVGLIGEDVANALQFLKNVRGCLNEYDDNRLAQKIVVSETAENVAEMEEYLAGILVHPDLIYRQAAAIAYLKSALSGDFKSREEADEALRDMEKRGLLIKDRTGRVIVGYQHYKVSDEFGMEAEDLTEIGETVSKFSRLLKTLVYQQRQQETDEAEEMATTAIEDVMGDDKKNGTCLTEVPPEMFQDGEGKDRWRGGGQLFVRFTCKEVIPIKGIGSIERIVREMVEFGVRLPRYTLSKKAPPGSGNSFERARKAIESSLGLNVEQAQNFLNKEKVLWYLIQRAYKAAQSKKSVDKLKKEFLEKATITPCQFFGFNGSGGPQEGTACLAFDGVFQQEEEKVYGLFFMVNASNNESKRTVVVTEVPKHLNDLLGEYVGAESLAEDDFFSCPPPLRKIIRAIRGQVEMANEISGN